MQHIRLSSGALRSASMSIHFHDSTLILLRTDTHHDEELIDQARLALRTSNPGASLLRMDSTQPALGAGHGQGRMLMQLFERPRMRARLLAFPAHEILGHIALQLLIQGIPISALSAVPMERQYLRINPHDLLLVLPCENELPPSTIYLH